MIWIGNEGHFNLPELKGFRSIYLFPFSVAEFCSFDACVPQDFYKLDGPGDQQLTDIFFW